MLINLSSDVSLVMEAHEAVGLRASNASVIKTEYLSIDDSYELQLPCTVMRHPFRRGITCTLGSNCQDDVHCEVPPV